MEHTLRRPDADLTGGAIIGLMGKQAGADGQDFVVTGSRLDNKANGRRRETRVDRQPEWPPLGHVIAEVGKMRTAPASTPSPEARTRRARLGHATHAA